MFCTMILFQNFLLHKCFGYHTIITDYYANSRIINNWLSEKLVSKYL